MSVWTLKGNESLLVLRDEQFNTLLCCHDTRIAQSCSNDTAQYITPYPLYPTQKLHPPVFSLLFFHHFALFHFPSLSPLLLSGSITHPVSLVHPTLALRKVKQLFCSRYLVWNQCELRLLLPKGHANEGSKPVKELKLHYVSVNHKINYFQHVCYIYMFTKMW